MNPFIERLFVGFGEVDGVDGAIEDGRSSRQEKPFAGTVGIRRRLSILLDR